MFGTSGEADYGSRKAALSVKAQTVICNVFLIWGYILCLIVRNAIWNLSRESKSAAIAAVPSWNQKKWRKPMKKKEQEEQLAAMAQEMDPFSGEGTDTEFSGDNPPEKSSPAAEPVHAYVDKGQRYDDMSSSASAFFLVGGVLAIGAALCLLGIFHLPMAGFQKYMFEGVLVVLAIGSFVVAVSSRKRAAELKVEADDEKRQTQEIIDWFLKNYSAKELDEQLLMEDPDLSGEELSLKRFELIQDFLITGRDIPDQSYAVLSVRRCILKAVRSE